MLLEWIIVNFEICALLKPEIREGKNDNIGGILIWIRPVLYACNETQGDLSGFNC